MVKEGLAGRLSGRAPACKRRRCGPYLGTQGLFLSKVQTVQGPVFM